MADLFVRALIIHLTVDFLLQPTWMALNKHKFWHPAGWLHGAMHAGALLVVMPWEIAVLVGFVHRLIDTYVPVGIWLKWMRPDLGTFENPSPLMWPAVIWADQTLHVATLYVAAEVLS